MLIRTAFSVFAVPAMLLSDCASIFNGSTQTLHLQSSIPATKVTVSNNKQATVANTVTPADVIVKGNDGPFMLIFLAPNGDQKQFDVRKKVSGWVFANIAIGGIIGFGIDAATGSIYTIDPPSVTMDMKTGVNTFYSAEDAK